MKNIVSGDSIVNFEGPQEIYEDLKDSKFAGARIPELSFAEHKDGSSLIKLEQGGVEASLNPENEEYKISGDLSELSIPQLSYLVFAVTERTRQEDGKYTLHASSVRDENGILFLGESESGKTTLSLKMSLDMGYDFTGDDRVVLNSRNQIIGGNNTLRLKDYNFHDLDLESYGFEEPVPDKFYLPRSEFGEHEPGSADILVFPTLKDEELKVELIEKENALLRTYKQSSLNIRTTGYALLGWKRPYPSFDSEEIAEKRYQNVDNLTDNAEVLDLSGRPEDIVEFLDTSY